MHEFAGSAESEIVQVVEHTDVIFRETHCAELRIRAV